MSRPVFATHSVINVEADGTTSRHTSQLPAVVKMPTLRVSLAEGTDDALAARLLRQLADDLDAASSNRLT